MERWWIFGVNYILTPGSQFHKSAQLIGTESLFIIIVNDGTSIVFGLQDARDEHGLELPYDLCCRFVLGQLEKRLGGYVPVRAPP